jgi:type I restriction enzyme S subunit
MKDEWNLPSDWEWTTLGEITDVKGGITLNKSREIDDPVTVPYLRVANVQRGHLNLDQVKTVEIPRSRVSDYTLQRGDILFNEGGDRDKLGRGWIWNEEIDGCCHQNHVFRARPIDSQVDSKFVSYWGNEFGRTYFEREGKQTTNLASINRAKLRALPVPLPPLPEQRRIVARIEELFSRLDAGVAALRHAKAQLQRYRQSVLAAAVTGQLTQAWREQHPDTEPAEELLERLLKQKREQWDGKRKYKEPPTPVTDHLPELPASWTWATVAQQAAPDERAITDGPFGSKLKSSHYTESGPRVLRLQNIGDGVFKDEYAHIPEEHFESLRNHEIFAGDLVIRALGIPAHQACIVPPSVGPAIVKADCIRFKVFDPHINPRYTLLALNSHPVRSRSEKHIHGVGRPRLNGTEIKSIALPLPPLAEQHQIVDEVEARTTAIDHLEAELDRQITRSNRLRQSTLSAAFAGNLHE